MNPFGATLVLLLTARDAKRIAAASKVPRTRGVAPCSYAKGGGLRGGGALEARFCAPKTRGP